MNLWRRLCAAACAQLLVTSLGVASAHEAGPTDPATQADETAVTMPNDQAQTAQPAAPYAPEPPAELAARLPDTTPASVIDAGLDVLERSPTGAPLLARARANQVAIYSAAWLPGAFAEFDQRRTQVILSRAIWSPEPHAVAALVAHELQHLSDYLDGRPQRNVAECEDWELRAHRSELQVWTELGGWDLPSDGSPYREWLESVRNTGDRLPDIIHQMYQQPCGWYATRPGA